jgi:hypothetical protein
VRVPAPRSYVDELVEKARLLRLATDVEWLRLGHWRWSLLGRHGEPDGPEFYLAPNGKSDPDAELEATLRGFFEPGPDEAIRPKRPLYQHPYCRFPARRAWLDRQLHFDPARLPARDCPEYRAFLARLDAESATVVFSSYFLSNPASAFGHTFLRINKRGTESRENRELLDTGVNYAAYAPTKNPFVYALRGLFGLWEGNFSVLPYYYKVREYNGAEFRDLWEYELNLSQEQLSMVVSHIWELGSTYFDYYFLSENCSYHITAALEVGDSRIQLLKHVGYPVVPVDTIKALYKNPGLVKSVHYRPSADAVFRARIAPLSSEQRDLVEALASDPQKPIPLHLSPKEQADVLDAAVDYIDVRYPNELIDRRDTPAARMRQRLLERRAEIDYVGREIGVPTPWSRLPHAGHDSSRLGFGLGYASDRGGMYVVDYRLLLHDLGDPSAGYPELATIEFLAAEARIYPRAPRLSIELEDFSFLKMESLAAMTRFSHNPSWRGRIGATRFRDDGCNGCLAGTGQLAGGVAFSQRSDGLAMYVLAEVLFAWSPPLHGIGDSPVRLGVGPVGGVRVRFTDDFVWLTTSGLYGLPGQAGTWTWSGESSLRLSYRKNFVLAADVRQQPREFSGLFQSLLYF